MPFNPDTGKWELDPEQCAESIHYLLAPVRPCDSAEVACAERLSCLAILALAALGCLLLAVPLALTLN